LDAACLPFDLERGPVFRADLFSRHESEHVLLITAHHIAIDGWSLWVLLDELGLLYRAAKSGVANVLSERASSYSDFVRFQTEMLAGPEGERLREYWSRAFEGGLNVLDLPTFRPRVANRSHRGASHSFELDEALSDKLRTLARAEGATLYTVLLAAYQVLLSRYAGQQDFVIGSPASARGKAEFAEMVGCLFNVVPLRAELSNNPTFKEFLSQTSQTVLGALEHQDYPSHLLAGHAQPGREHTQPGR